MIRPISAPLQLACLFWLVSMSTPANAQDTESTSTSVTTLMRQMTGTWHVRSRMWPSPNAKAIELPAALARREFIRDTFLQEVMEPSDKAPEPAFTRIAYLSYNSINQQYEYFSIDSRLPQMMSYAAPGTNKMRDGKVELIGTSFEAPQWGEKKNVPFMYRLSLGPVQNGRQVVQMFLTEQNGEGEEFLAFEYVYER